jgi:cytochrome c oxidase subunit 2
MKLIVIIVIVLGVLAIAQLMRVYELTSKLRGRKEEDISLRDNNFNAALMIVFMLFIFGMFGWLVMEHGDGRLGPSATEHGIQYDWLLNINWIIVIATFFLCNALLFIYAYKYRYHPDRKAYYFPHSNKLELIWTTVPALVLAVIIIFGLKTWNDIMFKEVTEKTVRVELYSKQFDWTVRYAGDDNKLGKANFRFISEDNPLGLVTNQTIENRREAIDIEVNNIRGRLCDPGDSACMALRKEYFPQDDLLKDRINETFVYSIENVKKMENKIERMLRHQNSILMLRGQQTDSLDRMADDDIIEKELHLIVDKDYLMTFRSQDVIHSAYMPHLRVQMNTVPGMVTNFKFKPIITTKEMRKKPEMIELMRDINRKRKAQDKDPVEFDYMLLCNKICGAAHSNMQIKVIIETQEEYDEWMKDKQTFAEKMNGDSGEADADSASEMNTSGEIIVAEAGK